MRKGRLLVACFLAAALVVVTGPGYVMAKNGGDGEPGAGCDPHNNDYLYNPPIYTGTVIVEWRFATNGTPAGIWITGGRLEQIDNPACYVEFGTPKYVWGISMMDFQMLTPGSLRQACLPESALPIPVNEDQCDPGGIYFPDKLDYWEILAVTRMEYLLPASISADVIVMGLDEIPNGTSPLEQ